MSKNERTVHRVTSKEWSKSKYITNPEKSKRLGAKTLYFVDSCTERQLDGGHRRHGSAGSAGSGRADDLREKEGSSRKTQEYQDIENYGVQTSEQVQRNDGAELNSQTDLLAPKPNRIPTSAPKVPISPRDDYSLGENSHILPDDTLHTEFGLEIRSEPNRSPLLIRDSDTNSDGDSVRSSTEPRSSLNQSTFRTQYARRSGSLRSKLTSSLSQQITRQKTLMHARGIETHSTNHGIGHHRSTSDPSIFSNQKSVDNHSEGERSNLESSIPHRRSFQGFISPADSLDPHGYTLASGSQSSRGFTYAETIDSNDVILSPDISFINDTDSLPPFMKKSLSLDDGLNNYTDSISLADSANDLILTPPLHSITSQSLVHDHNRDSPTKRRIESLHRKGSIPNSKSLSETTWTLLKQQVLSPSSSSYTD